MPPQFDALSAPRVAMQRTTAERLVIKVPAITSDMTNAELLVKRLSEVLKGQGTIGRVGGEEFTILLPDTSLEAAAAIAESIRHNVACRTFECLPQHPVTASFGISWSAPGTAFEYAYSTADAALYEAKKQGRNRVVY